MMPRVQLSEKDSVGPGASAYMIGRPSRARELFEYIFSSNEPAARVMAFVNSVPPTFESEYLDFKGCSTNGREIADDDVKKTWSEAIAGFATTSGGVLVWGIDARRDPETGVDHAGSLSLATDTFRLKSRLQQLYHEATDPPVANVRIEAVTYPEGSQGGFIVCYVPESDFKPHRQEMGKSKRWVMRIGDSFRDVPVPVLRSLFYPHRNARFAMAFEVSRHSTTRNDRAVNRVDILVRLHNSGPSSASDVVVTVPRHNAVQTETGYSWIGDSDEAFNRYRQKLTIHHGQYADFAKMYFFVEDVGQHMVAGKRAKELQFEFGIFAMDQAPQLIQFRVDEINMLTGGRFFEHASPMELQSEES